MLSLANGSRSFRSLLAWVKFLSSSDFEFSAHSDLVVTSSSLLLTLAFSLFNGSSFLSSVLAWVTFFSSSDIELSTPCNPLVAHLSFVLTSVFSFSSSEFDSSASYNLVDARSSSVLRSFFSLVKNSTAPNSEFSTFCELAFVSWSSFSQGQRTLTPKIF